MQRFRELSIKRQMIIIFVSLVAFMIAAIYIINVRFLEPYYISNKKVEFQQTYAEMKKDAEKGVLSDEDEIRRLRQMAEKGNISFLIMGTEGNLLATNVHDEDMLNRQLIGNLLDRSMEETKILDSADDYQMHQTTEKWSSIDYIEMWGRLDDDSLFIMRSPLESIRTSANISNRFLLIIGSLMILLCVSLVWYLSKKITAPILELAALSNRMAHLDFEAKYSSGGASEIVELGDNFNKMSDKLQQTISELKSANNALQKDIEQKEKIEQMRNEFLGNVSHELKTPIALIQGYAEGLKEGISDDPESQEFYCDVILDEASKMNQMVKNLLTLNQMEFGNEEIIFERFNLAELIRGVLMSMEILMTQEQIKLHFEQEVPVYVWADEYKVEQVVRNYVSNAIHHASGEKVVEVKMESDGEKARVHVFNTGTPIPEKDLRHIWEKFYKVDKAHTRSYGGNGIGLSIVKAIMESFHQKYGVKNYENGVEFWFELDVK